MKENPDRKKSKFYFTTSMNRLLSIMGEERLNALSLVCIHQDIFLDYDKIIDIYAFKYQRRLLFINPR